MDRPRPLRLDEVRGFEYVELKSEPHTFGMDWNLIKHEGHLRADQTPVALCVRCGGLAEDPTRDIYGLILLEHHFDSEEDKEPVGERCRDEEWDRALEEVVVQLLERKLGLSERDRDALRSFVETVFTDPRKILQVKDLDNRVRDLENQTGRLWVALGIAAGLVAVLIASVVAIALALAS